MDLFVFLALLFAAACHAGWNAGIKLALDPLTVAVLMSAAAGVVALAALPFAGEVPPAAWPWLAASVVIHLFYFAALVEGYRAGDMSQVYPIARGSAPLMTALVAWLVVGEALAPATWLGIVLLAAGVASLSLRGGRDVARIGGRAVGFALMTAVTICAYTVIDGIGARLAGTVNAGAYAAALFVGNGVLFLAYGVLRRGPAIFAAIGPHSARCWRRRRGSASCCSPPVSRRCRCAAAAMSRGSVDGRSASPS